MKSIIWAESDTRRSFSDFSFIRRLDINTLININYGRKFENIFYQLVKELDDYKIYEVCVER